MKIEVLTAVKITLWYSGILNSVVWESVTRLQSVITKIFATWKYYKLQYKRLKNYELQVWKYITYNKELLALYEKMYK
jgi:ABC-type enterobactin transport system permease subunit